MKACRAINSRFRLFFNLDLSEIEVNLMITELISTYKNDINCEALYNWTQKINDLNEK